VLKRRQAIEPAIGHLKADRRMNGCWLAGSLGDALHTVLCAAIYNLRWLLRAIVRGRTSRLFSPFGRQRCRSCSSRRRCCRNRRSDRRAESRRCGAIRDDYQAPRRRAEFRRAD